MPRALRYLAEKEVKDLLRDPRILFGVVLLPLLLFPLMGQVVNLGMKAAVKQATTAPLNLAVADADGGPFAKALTDFLRSVPGNTVTLVEPAPLRELAQALQGFDALVYVPPSFSANISSGTKAEVAIVGFVDEFSVPELSLATRAADQVEAFKARLTEVLVSQAAPGADPSFVLDPLAVDQLTAYQGSVYELPPGKLMGVASAQLPSFGLMIVMLIIAQLAATSLAMEKEEKTLEILLSLPVPRIHILAGKLVGVSVVAALATATTLAGWSAYAPSLMPPELEGVQQITAHLALAPEGLAIVAATYFAGVLSVAALAMLLAALTQDVRSAQSLVGALIVPVMIPAVFTFMAGAKSLPVALAAIPFTHVYTALPLAMAGDYAQALLGAAYLATFTIVVLFAVAKLFTTERLLTLRLTLRKRRPQT